MKVLQGRHYNIYLRKKFQGHLLRLRVFTLTYSLSSVNMDTSIIDKGLQSSIGKIVQPRSHFTRLPFDESQRTAMYCRNFKYVFRTVGEHI